jgi:phosphatidylglycerol:prolipoprotein diacylglycerol transferase
MIPYILVRDVELGPLTLHPFGILVATGVAIGIALAMRRARKLSYDLEKLNSFITWMLVAGFIGAHVLDQIFYYPDEVLHEPWRLLMLWQSLSSFGGFIGALIGILLWQRFRAKPGWKWGPFEIPRFERRRERLPIYPFADLIVSVFPVAWIFGRAGCATVHDHLGALASSPSLLAVAYDPEAQPGPAFVKLVYGPIPRYDLGLLEMLFTVAVAALFALSWSKRRPIGTYVIAASLLYAPARFAMDFLRDTRGPHADARYGGLTPAQWSCCLLLAFGVVLWVQLRRRSISDAAMEAPLVSGAKANPTLPEGDPRSAHAR